MFGLCTSKYKLTFIFCRNVTYYVPTIAQECGELFPCAHSSQCNHYAAVRPRQATRRVCDDRKKIHLGRHCAVQLVE
jgi:hypothetical protein